ncbi:MAG: hypothetical protein PHP04_02580 [Bacteroidales bacterium]|nr:hypothetical protein [Bacteroidales bacterium]
MTQVDRLTARVKYLTLRVSELETEMNVLNHERADLQKRCQMQTERIADLLLLKDLNKESIKDKTDRIMQLEAQAGIISTPPHSHSFSSFLKVVK